MIEAVSNLNYVADIGTIILYVIILGLSLNMVVGYIGYLNLGHVGFWAIGSYTYTLLFMNGVHFFLALLAGGILAGISGFILGLPTLKLKSHYIAIASLGFTLIVYSLMINLTELTRGPLGIPGIPRPTILGISFDDNVPYFLLSATVTMLVGVIIYRLLNSPWGKILETIREDDIAAQALGKNTFQYKLQAFTLSAFFAGIAGGVYSSFFQYIGGPTAFSIPQLVFLLTVVMVGGAGSFWGSIVGSVIIVLLYEGVRFIPLEPNLVGPIQQATFALILILIMLFRPRGIMGKKVQMFHK